MYLGMYIQPFAGEALKIWKDIYQIVQTDFLSVVTFCYQGGDR